MKLLYLMVMLYSVLFAQSDLSNLPECVSINLKAGQYRISYGKNIFNDHNLTVVDSTYIESIENEYGHVWAITLRNGYVKVIGINGNMLLNSIYRSEDEDYLLTRFGNSEE